MRFRSRKVNSIIVKTLRFIGYKPKRIAKMVKKSQATIYRYLK